MDLAIPLNIQFLPMLFNTLLLHLLLMLSDRLIQLSFYDISNRITAKQNQPHQPKNRISGWQSSRHEQLLWIILCQPKHHNQLLKYKNFSFLQGLPKRDESRYVFGEPSSKHKSFGNWSSQKWMPLSEEQSVRYWGFLDFRFSIGNWQSTIANSM